jgi:hypothetical protein
MILKHFTAVCPMTKITIQQVYRSVTSAVAVEFLSYLKSQFVTSIKSIQVDGVSEFMGAFEKTCKQAQIHFYVLPPRRPKYNAHVERVNRTVKYEF